MIERIRSSLPKVTTVMVFDGAAPVGAIAVDALVDDAPSEPPSMTDGGDETAATMIYTSGTTGRPKGAVPAYNSGDPEPRLRQDDRS